MGKPPCKYLELWTWAVARSVLIVLVLVVLKNLVASTDESLLNSHALGDRQPLAQVGAVDVSALQYAVTALSIG